MSKEIAKHYLHKYKQYLKNQGLKSQNTEFANREIEKLNQALEWIEEQEDWVSVEENLPEYDGDYDVVYEDESMDVSYRFNAMGKWTKFSDYYGEHIDVNMKVTHWRERPQPPKTTKPWKTTN